MKSEYETENKFEDEGIMKIAKIVAIFTLFNIGCGAEMGLEAEPDENDDRRVTLGAGGCPWDPDDWAYCRDCGPCPAAVGDCDDDDECEAGLYCDHKPGLDVCKDPTCPWEPGDWAYCRDCGPCPKGVGDCDNDDECEEGLFCLQQPGVDVCRPVQVQCPMTKARLDNIGNQGPLPWLDQDGVVLYAYGGGDIQIVEGKGMTILPTDAYPYRVNLHPSKYQGIRNVVLDLRDVLSVDIEAFTLDSVSLGTKTATSDGAYNLSAQLGGKPISYFLIQGSGSLAAVSFSAPKSADFKNQGTFTTSSHRDAGITATGSAQLNLLKSNGMGVVGGEADHVIDGSEFVQFQLDRPALDVYYLVQAAGNLNGEGNVGDAFLEVFGADNQSLGVFDVDGWIRKIDVSALVNHVPVSRFKFTANVDTTRIGSVHYNCSVESTTSTYTLTKSVNGTGGSISGGSSSPYNEGTNVTLTALPNNGYSFDRWSVNGTTKTTNPITINMNNDKTVIAYFMPKITQDILVDYEISRECIPDDFTGKPAVVYQSLGSNRTLVKDHVNFNCAFHSFFENSTDLDKIKVSYDRNASKQIFFNYDIPTSSLLEDFTMLKMCNCYYPISLTLNNFAGLQEHTMNYNVAPIRDSKGAVVAALYGVPLVPCDIPNGKTFTITEVTTEKHAINKSDYLSITGCIMSGGSYDDWAKDKISGGSYVENSSNGTLTVSIDEPSGDNVRKRTLFIELPDWDASKNIPEVVINLISK